jgi:hypothetical protein
MFKTRLPRCSWFYGLMLSTGLVIGQGSLLQAATPDTAPKQLTDLITAIESQANGHQLEGLMKLYSPEFRNSDGLYYDYVKSGTQALWNRFPDAKYTTQLMSWEEKDGQLIADTITTITGSQNMISRTITMESTIRSRQYFKNGQLTWQEVLSEMTKIKSGDKPPEVRINLPDRAKVGSRFAFDVIVDQPLGNDVMLGGVLEERIGGEKYLNPGIFDLDVLPAGGIFKTVKAPLLPDNLWYSAILVRGDGMVLVTQRVTIEE